MFKEILLTENQRAPSIARNFKGVVLESDSSSTYKSLLFLKQF